jgi:hypothetical protein
MVSFALATIVNSYAFSWEEGVAPKAPLQRSLALSAKALRADCTVWGTLPPQGGQSKPIQGVSQTRPMWYRMSRVIFGFFSQNVSYIYKPKIYIESIEHGDRSTV